jgi:putative hemolysin
VALGTELLVIVGLVVLNGFFSGAEIALLSVRKTRLAELARSGKSTAKVALGLRSNPERLLATVQVGITVIGATAAAFGGSTLQVPVELWLRQWGIGQYASQLAFVLVVSWISGLSIVLGELVPKSLALRSSERFSLVVAVPLMGVAIAARPIVWLLSALSNLVLRPFRDQTTFSEARLSPEELQQLVEDAAASGTVDPGAGDIASRAIDLSGLRVGAILVPRPQVVTLSYNASKEEVLQALEQTPHARYPVIGDDVEDVRGYVLARELYSELVRNQSVDIEKLTRPVRFIVESRRAVEALRELQQHRTIMAVVVDEHGGFSGIVTMVDITEELIGDVIAEHSEEQRRIVSAGERAFSINGTTPVHEVNRELDLNLPEGPGFTTVAGLAVNTAGHMISLGEVVALPGGISAEVTEATPRQVRRLLFRLPTGDSSSE